MNSRAPIVSICLPAYRQPALVRRAVQSVFEQDFAEFELLVTDDSPDDAVEQALLLWRSDPRLVYHRNPQRLGSPANWNFAMSLAKGELIKFLHHDDLFARPDALRQFVAAIQRDEQAGLAFSCSRAIDVDGNLSLVHRVEHEQLAALSSDPFALCRGNFIGAPSAVIFRRTPDFRFDEALSWLVDVDAYIRLLGKPREAVFIDEVLVNVCARGEHQITRLFEADLVLRTVESLYLFSKIRPLTVADRWQGFKLIAACLHAFSHQELACLVQARSGAKVPPEERLAMMLRRLHCGFRHLFNPCRRLLKCLRPGRTHLGSAE